MEKYAAVDPNKELTLDQQPSAGKIQHRISQMNSGRHITQYYAMLAHGIDYKHVSRVHSLQKAIVGPGLITDFWKRKKNVVSAKKQKNIDPSDCDVENDLDTLLLQKIGRPVPPIFKAVQETLRTMDRKMAL